MGRSTTGSEPQVAALAERLARTYDEQRDYLDWKVFAAAILADGWTLPAPSEGTLAERLAALRPALVQTLHVGNEHPDWQAPHLCERLADRMIDAVLISPAPTADAVEALRERHIGPHLCTGNWDDDPGTLYDGDCDFARLYALRGPEDAARPGLCGDRGCALPVGHVGNHYRPLTTGALRSPEDAALVELAWGIIANAGGGDWTRETQDWQEAAVRWRDRYHAWLASERAAGEEER